MRCSPATLVAEFMDWRSLSRTPGVRDAIVAVSVVGLMVSEEGIRFLWK